MKACGVIVEYNPFHLGHRYHLEKAREQSKSDCIVAVMSGNWLQRGEPAFLDKWQRAKSALENGCDLVIEIPPHYALQSADFFSRGSIRLLNELNISALAFGTDVKKEMDYESLGQDLLDKDSQIKRELQLLRHSGLSFPNQMKQVYDNLGIEGYFSNETPNHLLGITYAKEVMRQNPTIQLIPIARKGQGYKEEGETSSFASGTAIRKLALEHQFKAIQQKVPKETFLALLEGKGATWEDFFQDYRYLLMRNKKEELEEIYQVEEGIENHLLKGDFSSFSNYLESVKTKRYSYTRLQRVMSYLLLNISKEDVLKQKDYLRILGFNEVGRKYLNQVKGDVSLPLITRQTKEQHQLLALNNRVDRIYQLKTGATEQIQGRFPWNI